MSNVTLNVTWCDGRRTKASVSNYLYSLFLASCDNKQHSVDVINYMCKSCDCSRDLQNKMLRRVARPSLVSATKTVFDCFEE